jgi:hypothetical protein
VGTGWDRKTAGAFGALWAHLRTYNAVGEAAKEARFLSVSSNVIEFVDRDRDFHAMLVAASFNAQMFSCDFAKGFAAGE